MASKNNNQIRRGRRMIPPFTRVPPGLPSGQLIPKYFNSYHPSFYQSLPTRPLYNQHIPYYPIHTNPNHTNPYHYITGPGPTDPSIGPSGSYFGPHYSYYQPELSPQWIQTLLGPLPYTSPTPFHYPIHNALYTNDQWDTTPPSIRELSPPVSPPVHRTVGVQVDRGTTGGSDGVRERVRRETSKLLDQVLFEKLVESSMGSISQSEIDSTVKIASNNIINS